MFPYYFLLDIINSDGEFIKVYSLINVKKLILKTSPINFVSRLLGYLRNFSIAILLGFSLDTDAVFLALSIIGIFIIFSESFDTIGIPKLVKLLEEDYGKFKLYVTNLFIFTIFLFLLNLFLSLILICLIPYIKFIPKKLASYGPFMISIFIFSIYSAFNFIFHFFGSITRVQKNFALYFFSEFVFYFFNFIITTIGLFFYKSYAIIPISFVISIFLATLILIVRNLRYIDFSNFTWSCFKKEINTFLYDLVSISSAYGALYIYALVDKFFAVYVGEKALSALNYAFLLATSIWNVLRFEKIAIIGLSENLNDYKNFIELFVRYIKFLLFISLPFVVVFFIFPYYIVKLLFGYGFFSTEDIKLTAEALKYYSFSVPFTLLWPIIFRAMIVSKLRLSAIIISTLTIFINVALNYEFVFINNLGIKGICIATFISYIILIASGLTVIILKAMELGNK